MKDLFKELFEKNISAPESPRLLENISFKYPYFTAACFFKLQQTAEDDPGFTTNAAMAALHFENPHLLFYRLNNKQKLPFVQNNLQPTENELHVTEILEPEENHSNIVQIQKTEEIKETLVPFTGKKEPMLFEPLFASDYFASQGIRLSEEVDTGDKLGKQLKSFTDWLKSMKKVHESPQQMHSNQVDPAVESLAEKSNKNTDVLTESMAEAFVQQGKLKKAVETFRKLSLLNPAKSAYFAAKIDYLTSNHEG